MALLVVATPSITPRRGRAQPVRTRVFEGLELVGEYPDWRVRIRFSVPTRYLRHTPSGRGDTINIQVFPLDVAGGDASAFIGRESLQIPRDFPVPIEDITYEGVVAGRPFLEIRFSHPVRFEVRQGSDLRSLEISLPSGGVPSPSTTSEPNPRAAELMEEGRRAMTAGEIDRAILIYTKVLSFPENEHSRSAQELLGLARERNGQLAHAKAEYETYLERYPDGEGAIRVRQRLDALVTARTKPVEPERKRPPESHPLDFQTFGSVYTAYRRESILPEAAPEVLADSSLFTDVHIESRLRLEGYSFRSQLSGGYRYEFLNGGSDETRTSSLFFEAEDHVHGLTGSIGRRSLSTAGVLGRFDGVRFTYEFANRWKIGALGGFAVDSPTQNAIEFNRYLAGISLDVAKIAESIDAQVYAIGQLEGTVTDRAAIGCELRYFRPGRFLATFVDYDVYFTALNLAQLVGSWQVTPSTLLSTYLDYRLVPTLTTRNALLGQGLDEIGELSDLFPDDEIKDLAEDRTSRAATLNFGVSHDLTDHLQIAGDFSATDFSGTRASGGIEETGGTGFEFSYFSQLIWNGVLKPGEIGILGIRFFDGSVYDSVTAILDARYPITRALRVNPGVRADYRMHGELGDVFTLMPIFRVDYRFWKLNFDADFGIEWRLPMDDANSDERWGYSMMFGVRYDY